MEKLIWSYEFVKETQITKENFLDKNVKSHFIGRKDTKDDLSRPLTINSEKVTT